ncbi:MAG: hypothetical protein U0Y82_11155 [Thermoleophilia bacterium]
MADTHAPDIRLVGYEVRTADGDHVGLIEGVGADGMRLHHLADRPTAGGWVPLMAVDRVDHALDTVLLMPGVDMDVILAAPPRADTDPDGWHKSNDWWADMLGHLGLFESEGRGSGPFIHHDAG